MLKPGDKAPAFTLPDDTGTPVSLRQFAGRRVVLYFYPKDLTTGCTAEACGFRDHYARFQAANAVVLGLSPDDVASHRKFKTRHALPFPLLSDETHAVLEKYGVWRKKSMYGRSYMGVVRTTVVIDGNGRIERMYDRVKVIGHAGTVLRELAPTSTKST